MTLTELDLYFQKPRKYSLEEFEKYLKEKKKIEKQIKKTSEEIYSEIDSLEVLSDEVGSERYNKHLKQKKQAEEKKKQAVKKLEEILRIINK